MLIFSVKNVSVFDTLGAMHALETAGMNRNQAEAVVQTASTAAGVGHDDPATKAYLSQLATKADFSQFATKADLAQFATKADLAQFATKADLEHFATKADLANAFAGLERRLVVYGIAVAGLLFTALKLF